jgi:peroxin-3
MVNLLNMLGRVQLNLVGRAFYLDSLRGISPKFDMFGSEQSLDVEDNNQQRHHIPWDVERKYLTFSWFLLNVGWKNLADLIQLAVRDVFGE